MTTHEKICIFCRRDCSDRDRVVDERGRYACRVCLGVAKRIRAEATRESSSGLSATGITTGDAMDSAIERAQSSPADAPASEPLTGEQPVGVSGESGVHGPSANPDAPASAAAIDELRAAINELRAAIGSPSPGNRPTPPLATNNDSRIEIQLDEESRSPSPSPSPRRPTDDADPGLPEFPTSDSCPACGGDIPPFSMLCVHCGTNLETGERLHAADEPEAPEAAGSGSADGQPAEPGDDPTETSPSDEDAGPEFIARPRRKRVSIPVGYAVGVLSGLLAASVWVLLRADSGDTMRVLAWAVGVAAGAGVYLGNRGFGDPATGRFAACVAGVAITLGMVGGALVGSHHLRAVAATYDDEHKQLATIADEIVAEWEDEQILEWPTWGNAEKVARDYRYWPFGYPQRVEAEARARWAVLSVDQRQARRERIEAACAPVPVFLKDRAPADLIWIPLGVITAYLIASASLQGAYNRAIAGLS